MKKALEQNDLALKLVQLLMLAEKEIGLEFFLVTEKNLMLEYEVAVEPEQQKGVIKGKSRRGSVSFMPAQVQSDVIDRGGSGKEKTKDADKDAGKEEQLTKTKSRWSRFSMSSKNSPTIDHEELETKDTPKNKSTPTDDVHEQHRSPDVLSQTKKRSHRLSLRNRLSPGDLINRDELEKKGLAIDEPASADLKQEVTKAKSRRNTVGPINPTSNQQF